MNASLAHLPSKSNPAALATRMNMTQHVESVDVPLLEKENSLVNA
jgi:hypothetical protein